MIAPSTERWRNLAQGGAATPRKRADFAPLRRLRHPLLGWQGGAAQFRPTVLSLRDGKETR
jgi:hypothetical protein